MAGPGGAPLLWWGGCGAALSLPLYPVGLHLVADKEAETHTRLSSLSEVIGLVGGRAGMQTRVSDFSLRQVLPWALGVRLKSWWQLDIWGEGETFLIWEGLS